MKNLEDQLKKRLSESPSNIELDKEALWANIEQATAHQPGSNRKRALLSLLVLLLIGGGVGSWAIWSYSTSTSQQAVQVNDSQEESASIPVLNSSNENPEDATPSNTKENWESTNTQSQNAKTDHPSREEKNYSKFSKTANNSDEVNRIGNETDPRQLDEEETSELNQLNSKEKETKEKEFINTLNQDFANANKTIKEQQENNSIHPSLDNQPQNAINLKQEEESENTIITAQNKSFETGDITQLALLKPSLLAQNEPKQDSAILDLVLPSKGKKLRMELGIYAGTNLLISDFSANSANGIPRSQLLNQELNLVPGYSISGALNFRLNKHWGLSTGLSFAHYEELFEGQRQWDTTVQHQGYAMDAMATREVRYYNQLRMYSVPVLVEYRLPLGRGSLGLAAGAAVNFLSKQEGAAWAANDRIAYYGTAEDPIQPLNKVSISYHVQPQFSYPVMPRLYWETRANLGAQFHGNVDFYGARVRSWTLGLQTGLRYTF